MRIGSFLLLLVAFVGGVIVTTLIESSIHCSNAHYPLINPSSSCVERSGREVATFFAFRKNLMEWIADQSKDYGVQESAIFFRDLQNGPTFGINEHVAFSPSSLLKVPVMIATLREAEDMPAFLQKEITIRGDLPNPSQVIDDAKTLINGQTYTVSAMLEKMILYSDNRSKDMLRQLLTVQTGQDDPLFDTLQEAGIATENYSDSDFLSVKTYAAFFRILYHTTYLSREMSEKALDLLTRTTFSQGIVAGVPSGIVVAHKFGILENTNGQSDQLHDCGIVYHPKRAYLLCIMTRGSDLQKMSKFIAQISSMAYKEVSLRYE